MNKFMKKTVLMMMGVLIALTSCSVNVNGLGLNKIEPSETIVKKEYKLNSFNEVSSRAVANVKIVQSEEKDGLVVLSAPENYIELFGFESKDEKLDISFTRDNINIETKNVFITVYTSNLLKLSNSGAASVSLDSLDTDNLDVVNSGVGTFKLNHVQADKINVKCSGVGDISIDGEIRDADLSCSGVGSIHAQELKANNTNAAVTGVGSITCYASDYIHGRVTGVGSLQYAGHPKKKDVNKPMTGSISEI